MAGRHGRRRGIGAQLVRAAEEFARGSGYGTMWLYTTNPIALAFYRRLGYRNHKHGSHTHSRRRARRVLSKNLTVHSPRPLAQSLAQLAAATPDAGWSLLPSRGTMNRTFLCTFRRISYPLTHSERSSIELELYYLTLILSRCVDTTAFALMLPLLHHKPGTLRMTCKAWRTAVDAAVMHVRPPRLAVSFIASRYPAVTSIDLRRGDDKVLPIPSPSHPRPCSNPSVRLQRSVWWTFAAMKNSSSCGVHTQSGPTRTRLPPPSTHRTRERCTELLQSSALTLLPA